jgi:rhodanese-related sulfurtransferase
MPAEIDAPTLKNWLSDGQEMALFDVREHGQYGMGHLFFSVPLPYSRFELGLPKLAPNAAVRIVLCDDDDGVAMRAAARAAALGYRNVFVLAGGAKAWGRAGCTLYAGVNVPSKVFGEIVEHERHTPRISAHDVVAMLRLNNANPSAAIAIFFMHPSVVLRDAPCIGRATLGQRTAIRCVPLASRKLHPTR